MATKEKSEQVEVAETPQADPPKAAPPKAAPPKAGKKAGPGSKKKEPPKQQDDKADCKAILRALTKYPTGATGLMVAAETGIEQPRCYQLMARMAQASKEVPKPYVRMASGMYQVTPAGMKEANHDLFPVAQKEPPKTPTKAG